MNFLNIPTDELEQAVIRLNLMKVMPWIRLGRPKHMILSEFVNTMKALPPDVLYNIDDFVIAIYNNIMENKYEGESEDLFEPREELEQFESPCAQFSKPDMKSRQCNTCTPDLFYACMKKAPREIRYKVIHPSVEVAYEKIGATPAFVSEYIDRLLIKGGREVNIVEKIREYGNKIKRKNKIGVFGLRDHIRRRTASGWKYAISKDRKNRFVVAIQAPSKRVGKISKK